MSGVIPTVLSPARVSLALASVGPPAGSGGLRVSANDPLDPGQAAADARRSSISAGAAGGGGGQPRTPSPSRIVATTLPAAPTSPFATSPFPATTIAGGGGSTRPNSGSGTGDGSPVAPNSARNVANRARLMSGRSIHSHPDSPHASAAAGGRVYPAQEASSTSLSPSGLAAGGTPRAYMPVGCNTRGSRGLTRDRSFASTVGSTAGQLRLPAGSMNGGFISGLDSVSSQVAGGLRPMGLQAAPGTVGGIDIARLAAIQRLLDEYDSDDEVAAEPAATSPRGEWSTFRYRDRSDSLASANGGGGGESGRRDRGSDSGSTSGLRRLVSLRSRKDMQHWQPSVSTMKGSLEDHQRRLKERAEVTKDLKRWTEQVLEDARRAAGDAGSSGRESDIARASSVRFKDLPVTGSGGTGGGDGKNHQRPPSPSPRGSASPSPVPFRVEDEFLDPEQELDDEEERRLEALRALPPNPRGLGAQLRSHFMAVVEEEVGRKFEQMRAKWEEQKGHEAEELRELREAHKELRRTHLETKDALDKANTRMDVMRLQMKASSAFTKAGKEAAAAAAAADGEGAPSAATSTKGSGHRAQRSSNNDGVGKGGKGAAATSSGSAHGHGHGGGASGDAASSSYYGVDDELHDKLRSIGSRRPTSPTGDGAGPSAVASAELQQQLRAHADAAMTLSRKLQDAEQHLSKLKLDKASLENQLAAARARAADPFGTGDGGAGGGGGGGKYDAEVQIYKLKQDKAALEQQLAAATRKGSGKGGVTKGGVSSASASSRGGGRTSLTSVGGGKGGGGGGAGGGKAVELAAELERLQGELAVAQQEAARSTQEAVERRMELHKVTEDLATTKTALDMALQQIAGVKDAIAAEKERADRAAAAAEAAQAAQVSAEASAAAANSAAAAALIKRSAATGEVQELLERLQKERDGAMAAANEAREQGRELSKALGQRTEEVMALRDQLLQQQMEKPAMSAARAPTDVDGTLPAAAAAPPPPPPEEQAAAAAAAATAAPPPPAAAACASLSVDSRVTAAAVAAMQSLGLAPRPSTSMSRRRPSSALVSGGHDGAIGVAAAAAAAAALVPAVLEILRQRVPDMVMALEGDLADEPAVPPPEAEASGAAAAHAAAAAAAAAAATLRESGNAAAAAAAGATAAAPVIASAFVELVRAELLHGDVGEAAQGRGGVPSAAGPAAPGTSGAAAELASGQLGQRASRVGDRFVVFHAAPPSARTSGAAAAAAAAAAVDGDGDGYSAAAAAEEAAAAAGGYSARTSAVMADGVTFYPLRVRDAARGTRRSVTSSPATFITGLHDVHGSAQGAPPHPPPMPHHTPYFEAAAAAVAAAAADLAPQTVSVPVHYPRLSSREAAAAAAAAHRRKAAFAQAHSSYFPPPSPAAAGGDPAEAPAADSDSQPATPSGPTMTQLPLEEVMAGGDADAAAPGPGTRVRAGRSAGGHRGSATFIAADGAAGSGGAAMLEAYGSVYVDPELASVLHVERVSAAAARAAGAGRGAISPEALGPSLRDRALCALQAPEPPPPPQQRPKSAAVRTLEAARQHILHSGSGALRLVQTARPYSAVLPPVAGPSPAAAEAAEAPQEAIDGGGGAGGSQQQQYQHQQYQLAGGGSALLPHQPHHHSGGLVLAGTGVKIRAVTANPQKGVQLPARQPRGARHASARGLAGRSGEGGARFEDEDAAAAGGASVINRLIPGSGLSPAMREIQLHTVHRGGAAATYLVSSDAAAAAREGDAGGGDGGEGGDGAAELPNSGPELAALARDLMAAQERAVRELEEAMSTRRELAEEVMVSRQQWLEEARRARALENELDGVRAVLVSLGIGESRTTPSPSPSSGAGAGPGTGGGARPEGGRGRSPP